MRGFDIDVHLSRLAAQNRLRALPREAGIDFSSNDYLGLKNHPALVAAFRSAAANYGVGAGAARLVTGNAPPHEEAEAAIASFLGTEAALLYNSGYLANLGILPSLIARQDLVFSDHANHASLVDGLQLSRARVVRYRHLDLAQLEEGLASAPAGGRRWIVTESLFSMEGNLAPLDRLADLADRYQATLLVDEAHATGILGSHGRGWAEDRGVEGRLPLKMGTLGKALGVMGGFAAGDRNLVAFLLNTSRSFIYTTGMPPAVAAAIRASLEVLSQEGTERRKNLRKNIQGLETRLGPDFPGLAGRTPPSPSPIFSLVAGEDSLATALSARLLEAGLVVRAIRPPTVPEGTARLRLVVHADHTEEELDRLARLLKETAGMLPC